jgi:hypothetical protein
MTTNTNAIQQPEDLIRFISNIPVLSDGTIPLNTMSSSNVPYASTLYTPDFSLSILARQTQTVLNDGITFTLDTTPLNPTNIVSMALNSNLATESATTYLLLRATLLESFAFLYTIDYAPDKLRYASDTDIKRVKTNINYIADYLSTNSNFYMMIPPLRDMNISFGYIEYQIGVIMSDKGVLGL